MGKHRVQVSQDRGSSWKYQWVDPKEFDPDKSILNPGDYVRKDPSGAIRVVGIHQGKLDTYPLDLQEFSSFSYQIAGEILSIEATTQAEADYYLVYKLIEKGLLKRTTQ